MEKCFNCEENFKSDKLTEVNGELYCSECMDENFISCEKCGELIHVDDYIEAGNGDVICEYCLNNHYTECNNCGKYFLDENVYTDNRITICQSCKDSEYYTCDECGDFVHHCNIYLLNDGTYCEYCFDQLTRYVINEYDFKPLPIFYGEGEKYFGIELEIDEGGDDSEKAKIITDCCFNSS